MAAQTAESMPPDNPSTTPGKAVLADIIPQTQDAGSLQSAASRVGEPGWVGASTQCQPPSARRFQTVSATCSVKSRSWKASVRSASRPKEAPSKMSSSWPPSWLT